MGVEVGRDGYRHFQIRLVSSDHDFFEHLKDHCPTAHAEEASTERDDYERKSGLFFSSSDTRQIRQVRYGVLREHQKKILEEVNDQSDREIDVYLDKRGNTGKTFLTMHLWERGLACVVPRSYSTASRMSAYLCSHYKGEKYIIVDIPRSGKITNELYESLEEIKDGLVFDERYHGTSRNIRGAIIIVFTNRPFKLDKLSTDRWRLHGMPAGASAPAEGSREK